MSYNQEEQDEFTLFFFFTKSESRNHIEEKDCSNLLLKLLFKCPIVFGQMAKKPL